MINLIHGDCLDLMKDIPDKSVDCVLTDPPYGTTACKWDSVIPFEPMWDQLKRITKDNGAICLFGRNPFTAGLIISNPSMYKYDWHWEKHKASNFLNAKKQPLRKTEFISVFYKKQCNYYPQGLKPYNKVRTRKSTKGSSDNFGDYGESNFSEFTNYPTEILKFHLDTSVNSTYKDVKDKQKPHPTQKPVALLEYLIKTYTLENETVLDFTMGSGSTGAACKNLNRKFIGIEKEEKYFEIAKKRINDLY